MLEILNGAGMTGTDYEEFKKENAELAKATKVEVAYGRDISLLSLCEVPDFQEPGYTMFWVLSDVNLWEFRKSNRTPLRARLKESGYPKAVLDELKATTGLMLLIDGEKYVVAQHAMATLSQQASVSGTMTLQRANFLRDMHLADAIFYKNEPLTIVYRETEVEGVTVKKVYAVFAGVYTEIPQTIVTDIAEAVKSDEIMGDAKVTSWEINHEVTSLRMCYPTIQDVYEKDLGVKELTPGLMIQTSDVGDSAIRVFGTMNTRRSYVITEEIAAKHTKKNAEDPSSIIEDIDKKIFFEHRKLPELLADLIGREAVDYSDPNHYENLLNLVWDIMEKMLKGVLTKRQIMALNDSIQIELDASVKYTLYDIAIIMMDMPERIKGIDDALMINVRKALSKAPSIVDEVAGTSVYLTA